MLRLDALRILLTGGTSPIGRTCVERVRADGAEVVSADAVVVLGGMAGLVPSPCP